MLGTKNLRKRFLGSLRSLFLRRLPIHYGRRPVVANPDRGSHPWMEFVSSNLHPFPIGWLKGFPSEKKRFCSGSFAWVSQSKRFSRVLVSPHPQKRLVAVTPELQDSSRKRSQMIARTADFLRWPQPLQGHSCGGDSRMNQQDPPEEPTKA